MLLRAIDNSKKLHWQAFSCHCFQYHASTEASLQKFGKFAKVKKK